MDTNGEEGYVNNDNLTESISSGGDVKGDIQSPWQVLTNIELNLVCSSEKLVNLTMLMMQVATKESEIEDIVADEELALENSVEKVLELDLLCGVLDSEVNEVEIFLSMLQAMVIDAREVLSSYENSGEALKEMEKMLSHSEELLRQSQEQVLNIKEQSSDIKKNFLSSGGEYTWKHDKDIELLENDDVSDRNSNLKMKTAEEQRSVLQMLEKSLARELDLEKKIADCREFEEDLKLRLHSLESENFYVEEEASVLSEKLFEGENIVEVLMGVSKELLGRLQLQQFTLNASVDREKELKSKLDSFVEQLKAKDTSLQRTESSNTKLNEHLLAEANTLKDNLSEAEKKLVLYDSEVFTLSEKVCCLEKQLKESDLQLMNAKTLGDENQELLNKLDEMSGIQDDLEERIIKAESRADIAEAKCKLLTESNMELTEELNLLKSSGDTSEKVDSLERQMRESDMALQSAVVSSEASLEKQSMLSYTIADMENVIEKLKLEVSNAENLAESAEDRCIILSETNSDLREKLLFLRGRMDCLKASLHQAEDSKKATAKDIRLQTKSITDLVMQLALERERLHKQISSLAKENKVLVKQLQKTSNSPVNMRHNVKGDEDNLASTITMRNCNSFKMEKKDETDTELADPTSGFDIVRNIDARQLNVKYVVLILLVLVISIFAASLFLPQDGEF